MTKEKLRKFGFLLENLMFWSATVAALILMLYVFCGESIFKVFFKSSENIEIESICRRCKGPRKKCECGLVGKVVAMPPGPREEDICWQCKEPREKCECLLVEQVSPMWLEPKNHPDMENGNW